MISGDLAKVADHDDAYNNFLNFILRLFDVFAIDEDKLILCPGNHDVSRKVAGPSLPAIQAWRKEAEDRDKANTLQLA